jgi:hypothetical protein
VAPDWVGDEFLNEDQKKNRAAKKAAGTYVEPASHDHDDLI